ncbi:MAG TPA: 2Fe-2S iron-sulfur cluster-binding protein [Flavobacteriales bacterium]|nr:2Fe-2S iron-sulfur cluster-binding protein [Flavobacteriales bacterium]
MMVWWYPVLVLVVVATVVLTVRAIRGKQRHPGYVRIRVNGERVLDVPTGGALLHALAREGISLPTTCGGTGSCAWCKCKVTRGGGRITDQEQPYFSRTQVEDHWRLACQVEVLRDMEVEVPAGLLHPKQRSGTA